MGFLQTTKLAFTLTVLAFHLAPLLGCAAQGESEQPGTCTLSCGGSRLGTVEFVAESITPAAGGGLFFCAADFAGGAVEPAQGPITYRFQVFDIIDNIVNPDDEQNLLQTVDPDDPLRSRLPKAGIAFEPVLSRGAVAAEKTNEEHQNGDDTISPFKYAGIVTPKAEWCTDSCGVATFEVWPLCFQGSDNTVSFSIISGAMNVPAPADVIVHSEPR